MTARLTLLVGWARQHIAELDVAERIGDDVREGLEKSQREFLLRQQLAAIRKELGEEEPDGSADYRSRVEAAELPDKVREAALREVGKLERASEQAPEAGWIRTRRNHRYARATPPQREVARASPSFARPRRIKPRRGGT